MKDLIEKLEAATEGSRELDAEIAIASGTAPVGAFRPCASLDNGTFGTGAYSLWSAPHYTSSLDAALTLVLKGFGWNVNDDCGDVAVFGETGEFRGDGRTPALALCIAALKARRDSMDERETTR